MKILLIHTTNASLNGITNVILNYARRTYEIVTYDFVICGSCDKNVLAEFEKMGNKVLLPPCSRSKHPIRYFRWLISILKKEKYDVIHIHGNSGTMYLEVHAAKKQNIPMRLVHSHSTSCKHMFVHKLLKHKMNTELTHAVACSDAAGKWLFDKEYIVLQNSIEIDKFLYSPEIRDEYRRMLNLENCFVIGHVGYMDTEKNHIHLLNIFKEISILDSGARLLLIGDGRLRKEIEVFAENNNLNGKVLILGKRSDVSCLYQAMDVFALPSLFEGLSIVTIEAQASGLKCVVSNDVPKEANITGNVEYIDLNDKQQWLKSLSKNFHYDRARTSKSAAEIIKTAHYDIENNSKTLIKIYEGKISENN